MIKFRKLLFFILYLIIFSSIAYRIKIQFFPSFDKELIIIQTIMFVFIFGFFMWKEALSNIFHLYLRYTRKLALKHLIYATIFEGFLTFIFYIGFNGISNFNFSILLIDPVVMLISFLTMYYWVASLSSRDFFVSNSLIISNTKYLNKSMLWLKDPHGKKNIIWLDDSKIENDIEDYFIKFQVSEVVLIKPDMNANLFNKILIKLKRNNIGFFIIEDDQFWLNNGRFNQDYLVRGYTNRDSLLNVTLKRLFDLLFAILLLFILFPIFILVAILIKYEDQGPVFYVGQRIGKNGRPIHFYKFRSMVINAEKLKNNLLHLNERPEGPLFKMKNDPRVTRIGRILRKFSIDELPQLINVFKGDLSLVGPRPHLASEVAHYKKFQYQRMDCIPGITCLAQIKDRNGLSLDEWIDLDLKYRNQWNFNLDFLILAKTIKMMFKGI